MTTVRSRSPALDLGADRDGRHTKLPQGGVMDVFPTGGCQD
ncbi:MAG: hypothetical protein JWP01_565 [Myxococcales bacterium]|nr:hypothetical protein [Myxococcales bacterium]